MRHRPILSRGSLAVTLALTLAPAATAQKTTRVLGPGGVEPNGDSSVPFISQTGFTLVFNSTATNLVGSDANGAIEDIFLYDMASQSVKLISTSTSGVQANGASWWPVCTAQGDLVVYWSEATNLDPADTHPDEDIYLYDRNADTTTLISPGGLDGLDSDFPYISPNGNWITFLSMAALVPGDTNGMRDVYLYEVATGALSLVSVDESGNVGTGFCISPVSVSNDGLVAFSTNSGLVAGDNNGIFDVYVRDMVNGITVRADNGVDPNLGAANPHISANGDFVVFQSNSSNFGVTDTNGFADIYHWRVGTNQFSLVSRAPGGPEANASSFVPRVSRFGRYVVFTSDADNLLPDTNGKLDQFWFDTQSDSLVMINVAADGTQADASVVGWPCVTQGGGICVYRTDASNLVPGKTTSFSDVFIGWGNPGAITYCTAKTNSQGCIPAIAGSGSPSATLPLAFDLTATDIINNKNGLFFYGLNGAATLPFLGGTLCVFPPLKRGTIIKSNGNVGPADCSGTFDFNFNFWMQSGNDANLAVGLEVNGQFWWRDPASADGTGVGLTDGVRFVICP